jgi:hypothetical protein
LEIRMWKTKQDDLAGMLHLKVTFDSTAKRLHLPDGTHPERPLVIMEAA